MSNFEEFGNDSINAEVRLMRQQMGDDKWSILNSVVEEKYATAVDEMLEKLAESPLTRETDEAIDKLTHSAYAEAMKKMELEVYADERVRGAFKGEEWQNLLLRVVRAMNAQHQALYESELSRKLSNDE